MQLPQVIQGSHPGDAGLSSREYMLAGHNTVPSERGIFLPVSRRMHPNVCRFISEQVYEGRLSSDGGAARQALPGITGLPPSGAHLVEVTHHGNSQSSAEEVAAIGETIDRLIGATFRDRDGNERQLALADILVVTPYNAQVNALTTALPKGARVGTVDKFQGQEAPVCLVSMPIREIDSSYADPIPVCTQLSTSVGPLDILYVKRLARSALSIRLLFRQSVGNGFLGHHVPTTCPGGVECFFIHRGLCRCQVPIDLVLIGTVTGIAPGLAYNFRRPEQLCGTFGLSRRG